MAMYEIAVLGEPSGAQVALIEGGLKSAAKQFGLEYGKDLEVLILPDHFDPDDRSVPLVIFFGGTSVVDVDPRQKFSFDRVPILPVASTERAVSQEIPAEMRHLNCLLFDREESSLVSVALSSLGLISHSRRVFLSYKRSSSTPAAIQLFSELSARRFDVFLDTHSVGIAQNFQDELWHQLCDSDVLITLQTPDYFESRWTVAEWGRALSKGVGVLSIDWPDSTPSIHTGTASRVELLAEEIDSNGVLANKALQRIFDQLERVRVTSIAARSMSLVDSVREAVERFGGKLEGIGPDRTLHVSLPLGRQVAIQPRIGVPTSVAVQEALDRAQGKHAAVIYDHVGIRPGWQRHIDWLAAQVPSAKWVRASEAGWELAGWHS